MFKQLPTADLWKVWAPLSLLVILGFFFTFQQLDPPPPKNFAIAAGPSDGAYHAFAERYREVLARDGYTLEIVETAGSAENQELLRNGDVLLALLQGGIVKGPSDAGEEALASIFLEPLWLFHRADFSFSQLSDLEGHRVAIGPPGSGTHALAQRLLLELGLDVNNADLREAGGTAAVEALVNGEVDAAFFVASVEAPYIRQLLGDETVELFSVQRARAYQRLFPFLSTVILGEGMLDLRANVPDRDVQLLAAVGSLVASQDYNDALTPLLIETLAEVHGGGGLFADPEQFPSNRNLELPHNEAARQYLESGPSFLQRILPYSVVVAAGRLALLLVPLLTLLFPVIKAAPPLYRWRIRSTIYRWYADLRKIEETIGETESDEIAEKLAGIEKLEAEIRRQVSVPPAYMDELYHLQLHIEMVGNKLRRRLESASEEELHKSRVEEARD